MVRVLHWGGTAFLGEGQATGYTAAFIAAAALAVTYATLLVLTRPSAPADS